MNRFSTETYLSVNFFFTPYKMLAKSTTKVKWLTAFLLLLTQLVRGQVLTSPCGQDFRFPTDAVLNVKDFGAKGDGVTDDTQAIKLAMKINIDNQYINGTGPKVIYFPNGTYIVSDELEWARFMDWRGQSTCNTIIKLKDGSAGYGTVNTPKAVISAGENGAGEGFGFDIHLFNFTIDVGSNNPGAIALRYNGANNASVRDITIRTSDSQSRGRYGLLLGGKEVGGAGPAILKNITITGFDIGIYCISRTSISFENLRLSAQRQYGILSPEGGGFIAIYGLTSTNTVPVYKASPTSTDANLALINATMTGGSAGQSAIETNSVVYLRNCSQQGYSTLLVDTKHNQTVTTTSVGEFTTFPIDLFHSPVSAALGLVSQDLAITYPDPASWVSPASFGANPNDNADDTDGIQQAIDSGAEVVYFPANTFNRTGGQYRINKPLIIRGNLKALVGLGQAINTADFPGNIRPTTPVFIVEQTTAPYVLLEGFTLSTDENPSKGEFVGTSFQHNSTKPLYVRNVTAASRYFYKGMASAGTFFLEDNVGGVVSVNPNQKVFLRDFNPEQRNLKSNFQATVENNGGEVWALGTKTENVATVFKTTNGGKTESFGTMSFNCCLENGNFPTGNQPFLIVTDASALHVANFNASYGNNYNRAVNETQNGVIKDKLLSAIYNEQSAYIYEPVWPHYVARSASFASCTIQLSAFTQSSCNDNGTPTNATDDYFTVSLTATASNGGSQYEVLQNGVVVATATYGQPISIGTNKSLKADGVTTYELIIRDKTDNTCQLSKTTTTVGNCSFPESLSNPCGIKILNFSQSVCRVFGPNTDKGDYFTVNLLVSVTSPGRLGRYEVVQGANADGTGGNLLNSATTQYGQSTTIGSPYNFKADGISTYTLTIRDRNQNCFVIRPTAAVQSCR